MMRLMTMTAFALCACAATAAPRGAEPALLPEPAQLELRRGTFTVDADTKVRVSEDPQAEAVAHYFGELLSRTRGLRTEIVRGANSANDERVIQFTLRTDPSANTQGYTLTISPDAAHVTATHPSGLFYGESLGGRLWAGLAAVMAGIFIATRTGASGPALPVETEAAAR